MNKGYQKYLSSKHWKSRREEVIERTSTTKCGDKRCHVCLKAGKLQIHHLSYERLNGEEDKDLVALCGSCHRIFHAYAKSFGIRYNERKKNRILLRALRTTRDISCRKLTQKFTKEERRKMVAEYLLSKGVEYVDLNLVKIIKRSSGIETTLYR